MCCENANIGRTTYLVVVVGAGAAVGVAAAVYFQQIRNKLRQTVFLAYLCFNRLNAILLHIVRFTDCDCLRDIGKHSRLCEKFHRFSHFDMCDSWNDNDYETRWREKVEDDKIIGRRVRIFNRCQNNCKTMEKKSFTEKTI